MSFIVTCATSGHDALAHATRALAAGAPYEIAFLDWQMPGMDGIATAIELRRRLSGATPHLIMVTSYGRDEVIKPAQDAGIEDVIGKPVTASLLFDAAIKALGGSRVHAAELPLHSAPVTDLSSISGARVLLVEDNELNQQVARELLQESGLIVDVADNGAIALERLRLAPGDGYAIVLMDMQMPVMDGLTATRAIRMEPRWASLPVVAMTANAMEIDRQRCLDAGMNDHITKPIDPDRLYAALLRWVTPQPGMAPSPAPQKASAPATAPWLVAEPIAGLDTKTGLRHALGREELYLSLLRKFCSSQRDLPARLTEALDQDDWSSAERLAHTLKGLSAQIGARELRPAAEQLELALRRRASPEEIATMLQALAASLLTLIEAIGQRLPAGDSAAPLTEVDSATLRGVCASLQEQLAADDFVSVETLEQNETLLRQAFGPRYAAIATSVHEFNLPLALQQLREAMAASALGD